MNFQDFKKKCEALFGQAFHFEDDSEYMQVRSHLGLVHLVPTVFGPTGHYDRVEYAVRGHVLELRPRHLAARSAGPSQDFTDVFEQMEFATQIQARRHSTDLEKIEQHIAELEKIRKCAVEYKRHNGARPAVKVVLANSEIALFEIYGDYINYEPSNKALEANGFNPPEYRRGLNKAGSVDEMMMVPITDKNTMRSKYVPRRADLFVTNARYVEPAGGENPYIEIMETTV